MCSNKDCTLMNMISVVSTRMTKYCIQDNTEERRQCYALMSTCLGWLKICYFYKYRNKPTVLVH